MPPGVTTWIFNSAVTKSCSGERQEYKSHSSWETNAPDITHWLLHLPKFTFWISTAPDAVA